MAHYAELDSNNIVVRVIPGVDEPKDGEALYSNFTGTVWKKTSYNTRYGKHTNGGIPFRKNYAGIGFYYDEQRDAFIPPKPPEISKWLLDEETCVWVPPIPRPNDGKKYIWNDADGVWVEAQMPVDTLPPNL